MPVLDINLRPSRLYISLLFIGWVGVLAILYLANFNPMIKVLIGGFLSLNFAYNLLRYAFLCHRKSVVALHHEAGRWQIKLHDGKLLQATIVQKSSLISRWLIILYFAVENNKQLFPCIILPDMLENSKHRQLLTLLRHPTG